MSRGTCLVMASVLGGLLLMAAEGVWAERLKVGVISQQAVMEKSKAGKRAIETMKEFAASRQRIISADDDELKNLEKDLKAQESGLSEAARREKAEQFRVKFENYQKRLGDFNKEVQAKQKEMFDEYSKKIDDAASAVGEREGYTALLDLGTQTQLRVVIYASPAIDLTDEVIKEFDKRYK